MTKEEQAQLIEKLVTELVESRTCENCKYVYVCDIDGHICNNEKSKLFCSKVDNTVYCNKFVSTDTKSPQQD